MKELGIAAHDTFCWEETIDNQLEAQKADEWNEHLSGITAFYGPDSQWDNVPPRRHPTETISQRDDIQMRRHSIRQLDLVQ